VKLLCKNSNSFPSELPNAHKLSKMATTKVNEDDAADSSCSGIETRGHEADDFEDEIKRTPGDSSPRSIGADTMASWAGQPHIKGSTETMRMALLTFSLVGLQ